MNVSAHIRNYEVVNNTTAHVIASLNFASEASAQDIRNALQVATKSKLTPVEGSVILREDGKSRKIVSAFLTLSSAVISVPEEVSVSEATGFRALSSNMFMDDAENLWELKAEGGRNLVRTHIENNMAEMEQLMASVSSCAFSSESSSTSMLNTIATERMSIGGGDMITYVSESGKLESTLVMATVQGDDNTLLCLSSDGEDGVQLSRNCVSMYVKGSQFHGELEQPEGMAAMAGAVNVDSIVDYYSRVFGYNQDYLAKLVDRIKNHAFA